MIFKIYFIVLLGFFEIAIVQGQEKYSKQQLIQWMNEGRFAEAYPGLELQYLKFPKDPDYTYYTGVCRVIMATKIPEAIEMLTKSTQEKTYTESWFYLGRAYMLGYKFADAEEAFGRFNDKASRDEKEKLQLTMYLAMCRNAQDLCTRMRKLNVVKIDTIAENKLLFFLNMQPINGRMERVEEQSLFNSRVLEGTRFTTSGNDKVFQSKYPFGKKQKDIFFSQGDDLELKRLKTVGSTVNTSYDEACVFYDATAPALYFSSQGHNSAGGYDIFRSYFDKNSGKWSKPENLGFPVNTPYDEVAYVTIPGTNRSLLASRRNAGAGKLVVYTIDNVDASPEITILSTDEATAGKLKLGKQTLISGEKINTTPTKEKPLPKISHVAPPEILNEENYQRLIHEALNLQIRSDSLKRLSDEKKELLISARYESDKTRLWQEIKALDVRAEEVQQKADILYKKARQVEASKQDKSQSSQVNTDELAQKAFTGQNKAPSNKKPGTETSGKQNMGAESNFNTGKPVISYRIQVGVFSKIQTADAFKGFSPLLKEDINNGNAFKYYVGLYQKVADAEKGLVKVKGAGFKDAYIIGFYNGKVVPLSRARELEFSMQKQ